MTEPKAPARGVVSPFARRPVAAVPATPAQGEALREFDNVATAYYPLLGQVYTLHLGYLPCKERDPAADAADNFGECLAKLRRLGGALEQHLRAFALGFAAPLGPKIVLTFGGVVLYAKANSRDPAVATAMAVDRLCLAVSSLRVASPTSRQLLDEFTIKISTRA